MKAVRTFKASHYNTIKNTGSGYVAVTQKPEDQCHSSRLGCLCVVCFFMCYVSLCVVCMSCICVCDQVYAVFMFMCLCMHVLCVSALFMYCMLFVCVCWLHD